jgi:signal transduction histidine kinase
VRDATAPAQANHGRHPQTRPDTFMPTPERLIELTHPRDRHHMLAMSDAWQNERSRIAADLHADTVQTLKRALSASVAGHGRGGGRDAGRASAAPRSRRNDAHAVPAV